MKIEIEGKNQTKKDLWFDEYYVGKIDEDHNEVKLEGLFDWFDDEKLNYALELHPISYFISTINVCKRGRMK